MYRATLAIKPMNKGQMVVTFKGTEKKKPNKPKTLPVIFGKGKNTYTWSDKMVVECISYSGDIVQWLKDFFTEIGINDVDMSDFVIEDNGSYYEAISWGEKKNVHFWFEVEKLA